MNETCSQMQLIVVCLRLLIYYLINCLKTKIEHL